MSEKQERSFHEAESAVNELYTSYGLFEPPLRGMRNGAKRMIDKLCFDAETTLRDTFKLQTAAMANTFNREEKEGVTNAMRAQQRTVQAISLVHDIRALLADRSLSKVIGKKKYDEPKVTQKMKQEIENSNKEKQEMKKKCASMVESFFRSGGRTEAKSTALRPQLQQRLWRK
jgi:hypothetical protein